MNNVIITSDGIVGTNFSEEFVMENFVDKKVLVVENGTVGTGNAKTIPDNIEKFRKYGCSEVDLATLTKENINMIFDYDICYFMGGSISNLLDLAQKTDLKTKTEQFLEKGMFIGESAGGIVLGEDLEWYFKLKRNPELQKVKPKYNVEFPSYKGLGIVKEKIYPHINRETQEFTINTIKSVAQTLNDGEYIAINHSIKKETAKISGK
jgi:peptidase E